MRRSILVLMVLAFVMAGMTGCGKETTAPEQEQENRAPGEPTINASAGAPADGATGVSISPTLAWNCTDPDGDALTFDVYLGTTSPIGTVSNGQSEMSYNAGGLNCSTTYNWKVAATLFISVDTVRYHIRNIYQKLQVHSQSAAASKAIRKGLI